MSFWSMIIAFAPWVSFKILISLPVMNPVFMVKLGIVVAAAICAYQAWIGLHKGALLWGGLLFFGFALITVPVLNNLWVMRHLGVLSHGTLASFTWLSILMKKPFTAEYAKKTCGSFPMDFAALYPEKQYHHCGMGQCLYR